MFDFLKRKSKKELAAENLRVIKARLARNQEAVYQAVKELNKPCTGREVSAHIGWDSASVTNRLSELTKKGRLKVAYNKRGLDGIWRHFYVINEKD